MKNSPVLSTNYFFINFSADVTRLPRAINFHLKTSHIFLIRQLLINACRYSLGPSSVRQRVTDVVGHGSPLLSTIKMNLAVVHDPAGDSLRRKHEGTLTLQPIKIISTAKNNFQYQIFNTSVMIHPKYKIFITLISAVFFLNLSLQGMFVVAQAAEESGNYSAHTLSIFNMESHDHCPACPSEDHKNTDHSHSSCEHHSSLYFVFQSLLISYHPIITSNNMHEVINTFPEVYLEKFIPPIIPSDTLV